MIAPWLPGKGWWSWRAQEKGGYFKTGPSLCVVWVKLAARTLVSVPLNSQKAIVGNQFVVVSQPLPLPCTWLTLRLSGALTSRRSVK